jgi:hypothetical protein
LERTLQPLFRELENLAWLVALAWTIKALKQVLRSTRHASVELYWNF